MPFGGNLTFISRINTTSEGFKARNIVIVQHLMVTAALKANASQLQDLIKSFNMAQTYQIQSKIKKVTDICNTLESLLKNSFVHVPVIMYMHYQIEIVFKIHSM